MQYVGRAFDSVTKTWNSINPSTLSGAIDVIVVENEAGDLQCSPFHVRFGKFQLLRPSQKKVDFIINGKMTNLPMKLGDGGEAFFVFEASKDVDVPNDMITSPVLSAASSPASSPPLSPRKESSGKPALQEPDYLDISLSTPELAQVPPVDIPSAMRSSPELSKSATFSSLATSPKEITLEKFQKISRKLTKINIPTKIDNNGDLLLDMNGYKSNAQNTHDADEEVKKLIAEEFGADVDVSGLMKQDETGNIKIFSTDDVNSPSAMSADSVDTGSIYSDEETNTTAASASSSFNYVKTLRLTSDQLKCLDLKSGANEVCFSVDKGKALITAKLFLWKKDVPIVISDIDGTITKSDALGHVLTMLGRDWTHPGVAQLFTDIKYNGYNIMYLTARSVGQADSTRSYLKNIEQEGMTLPDGPVILSPDRTIAALKREVILKKPEVFKMACLGDLKKLYGDHETPFYAGFGNRITDALSYRSVGIPSSRIFTINPEGDVHMELLELAGYKSSYVNINELVDHFFPAVTGSGIVHDENFTDVNFWREPLPELSDLSDDELDSSNANPMNQYNSTRLTINDDLDSNYNEEEDADYVDENDENDENDDGEDDDDDADEGEDDYYDDENDELEGEDEFSHGSDDESFADEDYDDDADELDGEISITSDVQDGELGEDELDADLLDSPTTGSAITSGMPRGILPSMRESSGLSLNQATASGLHLSSNSFVRASELMNKLSINDFHTPQGSKPATPEKAPPK
ncbi:CYFA0S10e03664g1_1 [Cyberlindnera fabianii]|uniref:CYFA0S10e03664g1_1 n=1 Tax=Cyberlindnera fabianii TaxID=36022 RepID=A0A061B088_CYBFA|nr:CYFA0S10e03664g1_1 [Cyberlindnera fabianii]